MEREAVEKSIEYLNRITGAAQTAYTVVSENPRKLKPNEGHYYLSGAYGRWALQVMNASGSSSFVLSNGHAYDTLEDLAAALECYIAGIHRQQDLESNPDVKSIAETAFYAGTNYGAQNAGARDFEGWWKAFEQKNTEV